MRYRIYQANYYEFYVLKKGWIFWSRVSTDGGWLASIDRQFSSGEEALDWIQSQKPKFKPRVIKEVVIDPLSGWHGKTIEK